MPSGSNPTMGAENLLSQLGELFAEQGPLIFFLVLISFLFWHLIWKVWHAAMLSKDAEIERLVSERDKYQKLVFEKLLTSNTKQNDESKH